MLLIIFSICFLLFMIFVLTLFFIVPWFFGAPFEPTKTNALKKIVEFSNVRKGDFIAELGSGDGRIVIELAKKGAKVHGYEINPFLVLISRWKIKKLKLKNVEIFWKSFWRADLSKYNKLVLFQFKTIMPRLEKKIFREMKKGSLIVSHYWKFPNLKMIKYSGKVFLYKNF